MPGIHQLLYKSIMDSSIDLRKDYFSSILLSGGTTIIPGFPERLKLEFSKLVNSSMEIKILVHPQREILAWIGGSSLASLYTFQQKWFTQENYYESGPLIPRRKVWN